MNVSKAAPLETQEYLYGDSAATQLAAHLAHELTPDQRQQVRDHIRGLLRVHRFTVINWLMQNGCGIPTPLVADHEHPLVGMQIPDQDTASTEPALKLAAGEADNNGTPPAEACEPIVEDDIPQVFPESEPKLDDGPSKPG